MGLCPSRNVERERDEEVNEETLPPRSSSQLYSSPLGAPTSFSTGISALAMQSDEEVDFELPALEPAIDEPISADSQTNAEVDLTTLSNDQTLTTNDVDTESAFDPSELDLPPNAQILVVVLPRQADNRPRLLLVVVDGSNLPQGLTNDDTQFQNLLNQLFLASQPKTHPTSPKAMKSLPTTEVDEPLLQKTPKCVICCEEFTVGQTVIKMPCDHIFERECVEPWLKTNNTCPVCRYELPVEDEQYEKERKEKMKQTRSDIDEVSFFGDDGKTEC